ncbi:MAG: TetR/AcrR family transcriptional regulator [Chloroflexi bacterium]|nr:MAG: TetR/AcrR family transcriptional regulator [Chloroflexota bacterium]TMF34825.1 MAG: TetR/AcrR family transcriptional regulator [Chloroflexota bacterium]
MARLEWRSDDVVGRRHELYARAAPVFRMNGYAGTTLKALALACGLSIPALYTYFPSKRAFALFPLMALYPELHGPPPVPEVASPQSVLATWVELAAREMPNYVLAMRLAQEAGLRPDERRRLETNLAEHATLLGGLARQAAPHLDERTARELAWGMIFLAVAPSLAGAEAERDRLRGQLRALLRGYGVSLPGPTNRQTALASTADFFGIR